MKDLSWLIEKVGIRSVLGTRTMEIEVIDRKTGIKFTEKVYGEQAMKAFYGSSFSAKLTGKLFANKFISSVFGAYNDSGFSRRKIEEFAFDMGINISECEKDMAEYQSFNEFFSRKLSNKFRPIQRKKEAVISPSDGRLLVFPCISGTTLSYVKWAPVSLFELFGKNQSLEQRYKNGACAILRLCPADYHRFHFPVSGKAGVTKIIPGLLHSVNPLALEHKIPVYCLNKRSMAELDSDDAAKVLMMEVGALLVGTIVQTYRPAVHVEKGDEKGYFKFGGSTVILFFEKDTVVFDADLIQNSDNGFETLVQMGEQIATVQGL